MINLLPPDYRSKLHYDRLNAGLRHWIAIGLVAIVGLIVILAAGWLYIDRQVKDLNTSIADTEQQLQSQNLEQVKKQADQISQNVRIINQVLGREIRFSELIQDIGQVMPNGTILGSLTLSKVSGALDLSASAKSYASAAQVAVNLSDPKNNIFAKVDIINISCSNSTPGSYPCDASFKALFDKKTQSRFLNAASGGSQ